MLKKSGPSTGVSSTVKPEVSTEDKYTSQNLFSNYTLLKADAEKKWADYKKDSENLDALVKALCPEQDFAKYEEVSDKNK
jgi:hypothetical protein